jgi:hypothetical protein
MRAKKKGAAQPRVAGVLGVGLDAADGQKRITHTEEMILVGGSKGTHERMQETAIKFSEGLQATGKKLPEITPAEAVDLLREAIRRTGG